MRRRARRPVTRPPTGLNRHASVLGRSSPSTDLVRYPLGRPGAGTRTHACRLLPMQSMIKMRSLINGGSPWPV